MDDPAIHLLVTLPQVIREMKKAQGYDVRRFILRNQLHPYSGLGQPDGTIRDVFIVEIRK